MQSLLKIYQFKRFYVHVYNLDDYVLHVHAGDRREKEEEGVGSPRTGVIGGCEP